MATTKKKLVLPEIRIQAPTEMACPIHKQLMPIQTDGMVRYIVCNCTGSRNRWKGKRVWVEHIHEGETK